MSGLNTSLAIGLQALDVTQGALAATSNNISNANTPGYTREVVEFSENQLNNNGGEISGGGVAISGLQSIRDELLNMQIQKQTSAQSSVDTQSSSLQQIETYFTTSGQDIASALTSFATSLSGLSASANSSSAQQSVITSGQNLARAFNSTANGLSSVQSAADSQVTQTVAQINTISSQIAQLNQQISETNTAGQNSGTLVDQRDELVQQLSTLTGISVTQSESGETITTGSGTPLVMGTQSFSLQTTTGSDGMQHVLDSSGTDITTSLDGGQLGGAIQVRDQIVPGLMTQLNTLATQFANAFNAAQAGGYDSNGNPGQAFFTLPSGTTGAAAGISVAITDPSKIAISSDGASESNGNVVNLSAALTNALPSGSTPAAAYASLVYQVGTAASNASTQSTAIGQSLQQLTNQQGAVSGVSIDEETTNLIRYQTAYQAAARIISTIQQLDADTINMVS